MMTDNLHFSLASLCHLARPVSRENSLDILSNSMWTTMVITGVFFASFLCIFLSVRVGKSIGMANTETEAETVNLSFLCSLAGLRYISSHVRHHLFQTPLQPRQRFSSLSTPWLPTRVFRRRSTFSFANLPEELLAADAGGDKSSRARRMSTTDGSSSRRASVGSGATRAASNSKTKRTSVPHVLHSSSSQNGRPAMEKDVISLSDSASSKQQPVTSSIPFTAGSSQFSADSSHQTRRNTLPNISASPPVHQPLQAPQTRVMDSQKILTSRQSEMQSFNAAAMGFVSSTILEADEEDIETSNVASKEECEYSDQFEAVLSELEREASDTDEQTCEDTQEEGEDAVASDAAVASVSMDIPVSGESAANGSSSYRTSYFNNLPETIFGYAAGLSKSFGLVSPPQSVSSFPSAGSSPPTTPGSLNPPPGFAKRASSHDFVSGSPTENDPMFLNHQPLYARRRTETILSRPADTNASSTVSLPSTAYPATATRSRSHTSLSAVSAASAATTLTATTPNRFNSASPSLGDLNSDDLFAPINWNYAEVPASLRRSWSSIGEEDGEEGQEEDASATATSPLWNAALFDDVKNDGAAAPRAQRPAFSTFSSMFNQPREMFESPVSHDA